MSLANNKHFASRKEEYELLYGMLKAGYARIIDIEYKQIGLLALVIGWFITSERMQLFAASSYAIRIFGTIVIILYTFLQAFWLWKMYYRSNHAYGKLRKLNYMPLDNFESYRMHAYLPISFGLIQGLLASFLVFILWSMVSITEILSQTAE